MRQVEEERLVLGLLNELDAAFGESFGELFLIVRSDGRMNHLRALDQRKIGVGAGLGLGMIGPHVVRVRDAVKVIEAVLGWQERLMVAEMPFAEASRGVTFLFEDFSQRHFIRVNAVVRLRAERAADTDAIGVTTGKQRGAGGGADRLGDVKGGELAALGSESVDVRRGVAFGSEGRDVGVAHVIHVDQDHVRPLFGSLGEEWKNEKERGKKKTTHDSGENERNRAVLRLIEWRGAVITPLEWGKPLGREGKWVVALHPNRHSE